MASCFLSYALNPTSVKGFILKGKNLPPREQILSFRSRTLFLGTILFPFRVQGSLGGSVGCAVAQLDARPTGDQAVADSTPAESATFFR